MDKKSVKDKVKAKAKAVKDKVKAKLKTSAKAGAAVLAVALFAAGCMETTPASRATTASYEITVEVSVDEGARATTVNVPFTFGDGALASADSAGSTETQTATPTMDIKPDLDVHYNDLAGTGGNAVATFMGSLTSEGMSVLRDYLANKKSGTVTVSKTDGSTETVTCENGKCTTSGGLVIDSSNCTDCEVKK